MRRVGFFTHSDCMVHDMGPMHPESPLRLQAIDTSLQVQGLMVDLIRYDAGPADLELVKRVHPLQYIHMIQHIDCNASGGNLIPVNGDTSMGLGSLRASLLAAGAGCQAIDKVLLHDINRAFCRRAIMPKNLLEWAFAFLITSPSQQCMQLLITDLIGSQSLTLMYTTEMEQLIYLKMTSE